MMRYISLLLLAAVLIVESGCEASSGQDALPTPPQEALSEQDQDREEAREQDRDATRERDRDEARERDRERDHERLADDEKYDSDIEGFEDAIEGLGEALSGLGHALRDEVAVEPVEFRRLRKVIPGELRGYEVTSNEGETNGAVGIHVSHVRREFENGDARVSISVVDLGSLKGLARLGIDGLNVEIDSEDDSGFERTTTFEGYTAHEKCERHGNETCELQLFIGDRFLVEVESDGIDVDELHRIAAEIDLEQLEDLQTYGIRKRD